MLRPRLVAVLAVALGLAVAGLTAAPSARADDACEGGRAALLDAPALRLLPADTLFVLGVRDPAALLDAFGRERVVARFRAEYDALAAEVREESGHDLLDPAQWPRIGVDPHGPMGFAWIDLQDRTFAVYVTLTDAGALETFLARMTAKDGETLVRETIGTATVLSPPRDPELRLVLRDGLAVLVVSDRGAAEAIATAGRVALAEPAESLAEVPAFRDTLDDLGFGEAAALWLDARRLLRAIAAGTPAVPPPYWQSELDRARNDGATAEALAELRARVAEERGWEERASRRRAAERALLDDLVASSGALALGAELGERAVRLRSLVDLPRDSVLRGLVRPGDGVPLLVRALGERPLYLAQARLDVDAALRLFERFVAADGGDMAEVRADFRQELGLDLDRDVVGALDGDVGFVVTGELALGGDGGADFFRRLGGAVVLGLRDEARGRALLDRLLAEPDLASLATRGPDGAWRVEIPFWKTLHATVAGGALIVTTDEGFVARARSGETGAWLAGLDDEGLGPLVRDDRAAAVYVADLSMVVGWFAAIGSGFAEAAVAAAEPAALVTGADEAPPSPEWTKLHAELGEVDRAIEEHAQAARSLRDGALERLVSLLGETAFVGRVEDDRLVACGGQFVGADSLAAFGEGLVSGAVALSRADDEEGALWELRDRRWHLLEALARQREEDVRRHQDRKSPTGN